MRKLLILLFLFSCASAPKQSAFELTKMNVVYIGVPNPFNLVIQGVPREDLRFATKNCEVVDSSGQFYLFSFERGDAKVWILNQKGDTLDKRVMRSRHIPRLQLTLGTLESGAYTRGAIRAQPGLYATIGEGFAYEGISYRVDSAYVSIEGLEGATLCKQKGTALHPLIRKEMAQPFSRVMVWNAHVSLKSGTDHRRVSPITIQCKDVADEFFHYPDFVEPVKLPELGQCIRVPFDSVTFLKDKKIHRVFSSPGPLDSLHDVVHFIEGDTLIYIKKQHFQAYYPGNILKEAGEVCRRNDTLAGQHIQGQPKRYSGGMEFPLKNTEIESLIEPYMYPIGYWRYFHPNGKLFAEGEYKIDKVERDQIGCYFDSPIPDFIYINRIGTWKFYDEEGKLVEEIIYD